MTEMGVQDFIVSEPKTFVSIPPADRLKLLHEAECQFIKDTRQTAVNFDFQRRFLRLLCPETPNTDVAENFSFPRPFPFRQLVIPSRIIICALRQWKELITPILLFPLILCFSFPRGVLPIGLLRCTLP